MLSLVALPLGFALGLVPFAHLLARRHGVQIATTGSGNVGAFNAARTTGSRRTGLAVMLLDAAKGLLAAGVGAGLVAVAAPNLGPWIGGMLGLAGAVAGHVYHPVLSWRHQQWAGGKGLATATGGLAVLLPLALVGWGVGFGMGYAVSRTFVGGDRGIDLGNLVATATLPLTAWALYALVVPEWATAAAFATACLAALVLPKLARTWPRL